MTAGVTSSTPARRDPVEDPRSAFALDPLKYWVVLVALGAGALIAYTSHRFLPAKIFLDESTILRFMSGELQADGWSSYSTTGWLYRVTGLGSIPGIFPVLAYGLFAVLIVAAIGWRQIPRLSMPAIGLAAGSLLLGAVYLSQYSKEFFVLPLAAFLLLARRSIVFEFCWLVAALLYAGFVREYWFLVVAFYVAFRILLPRLKSAWLLVPVVMIGFAAAIIAFEVAFGSPLTFFRTDVNNSLDIDRSTQIDDIVGGQGFAPQWLNSGVMMLLLAFPLKLLTSGSALQLLAGSFLAVCWAILVGRLHRAVGSSGPYTAPLAFLLAYLMVQTAFEPDYGSYIRHITPQLPLFFGLFIATSRHQEAPQ